jgi:hypothetical protein
MSPWFIHFIFSMMSRQPFRFKIIGVFLQFENKIHHGFLYELLVDVIEASFETMEEPKSVTKTSRKSDGSGFCFHSTSFIDKSEIYREFSPKTQSFLGRIKIHPA